MDTVGGGLEDAISVGRLRCLGNSFSFVTIFEDCFRLFLKHFCSCVVIFLGCFSSSSYYSSIIFSGMFALYVCFSWKGWGVVCQNMLQGIGC